MAKQKGTKPPADSKQKEHDIKTKQSPKPKAGQISKAKEAETLAQKEDKKTKQFDLHPHGHGTASHDHHQQHRDAAKKDSRDDALAEELLKAEKKKKDDNRHHRHDAAHPATEVA